MELFKKHAWRKPLRWVTSQIGVLLLLGLTTVTLGPLVVAWWAQHDLTLATTLPVASIAALWLGFLYQRNTSIRRIINGILVEFGNKETYVSAKISFQVSDKVNYAQIVEMLREYSHHSNPSFTLKAVESHGLMNVDMEGWRMQLALTTAAEAEFDGGEIDNLRDLIVSVPETVTNVSGAKRLLITHILPLLCEMKKDNIIKPGAASVKVRFASVDNPYLSTYFQNIKVDSIAKLECVLRPDVSGKRVTLTVDSVTFTAPDLVTLSTLLYDQLGLFR